MATMTVETLTQKVAQALGEAFGTSGAQQAYNVEVAEKVAAATTDPNYVAVAAEALVYDAYMDAVTARKVAALVEEMLAEG